jgi:hypothetical protein
VIALSDQPTTAPAHLRPLTEEQRDKTRGYIRAYLETIYRDDHPLGLPLFHERRMAVVIERSPTGRHSPGATSDPTCAEALQERDQDGEPIVWRWVETWSWKPRAELDAYLLANIHRHCYVALISGVVNAIPYPDIGAPWRKSPRTIRRYIQTAVDAIASLYFGDRWDGAPTGDLPPDDD